MSFLLKVWMKYGHHVKGILETVKTWIFSSHNSFTQLQIKYDHPFVVSEKMTICAFVNAIIVV